MFQDFEAKTLVGRLASRKIFPKLVIFPPIMAGWHFAPNMRIEDAGPNRFLFSFQSMEEKEKVLRLVPWNFKGYLMILKEWRRSETINEVDIAHAQFWVQIHELPMESLDEENANVLGRKMGSMMQVEMVDVNKPYLWVQVQFDIETCNRDSVCPGKTRTLLGFLSSLRDCPNLCFICGRITHSMGTCIDVEHLYKFALSEEMRGTVPVEEMVPLVPSRLGPVIGGSRLTSLEREFLVLRQGGPLEDNERKLGETSRLRGASPLIDILWVSGDRAAGEAMLRRRCWKAHG